MNLLIMGGPGAGKGTLSEKILAKFNILHISTGDIFRSEIANQTKLGLEAKKYIDQGLLVPDEVTNPMVKDFLAKSEHGNGYLLDGYPRTLDQATAFNKLVEGTNLEIDQVIALDIPFTALAQRITGRRVCKQCGAIYHTTNMPPKMEGICDVCGSELVQRKDDTVESLQVRVGEYTKNTEKVLEYYENSNLVTHVNADQPLDAVWADVQKILAK